MIRILNKIEDYKKHNQKKVRRMMDLFEFVSILVLLPFSSYIAGNILGLDLQLHIRQFVFFSFLTGITWFILSRISVMSKIPRTQRYLYLIFQLVRINFIFLIILIVFKFALQLTSIPVFLIFIYVSFTLVATVSLRLFAFKIVKIYRANGYNLHRVLIVADSFSEEVIANLVDQKDWGFKIAGIVSNSKLLIAKYGKSIKIYSDIEALQSIIDNTIIDEVIYCRNYIDEKEIKDIVAICDEVGVLFRLQSTVSPLGTYDLQFRTLNPQNYLSLVDVPSSNLSMIFKVMGDFYFSISSMVIFSPFFLLIALLIKLDSRGPVFFKQERVGLRGRRFNLYKFRTMVTNAEEVLEKLKAQNEMDGPTFKMKNDPRITKIGHFLRKTGLDELPQLYNVVRGEMSLIGPRPPLSTEVEQYERWQLRRLSVKPGITCSWQIVPNRNEVKFEKWMHMDLNYIDNWSLTSDLKLLLKTVSTIFLASGR